MNQRVTGAIEALVILVAMVFGAVFIFFAYELGQAARPVEMMVWGSTDTTSGATSSPSDTVSAPAISTTPTPSTTASGSGAGKAVFDRNCTACHPGGNKGVGPALNAADFKQRYPQDSDVATVIRNGKGMMPAFNAAALSDSDLTALVGYVRSLSGGLSAATGSPTSAPSGNNGTLISSAAFENNCAACHPGAKKGVGPAISGPEFRDKYWLDKDLYDIIRNGRNAMPAFKPDKVSDQDILSIIAYLRSIP